MSTKRWAWVGGAAVVAGGCTALLGVDEDYYLVECVPGELGCAGNAPQNCRDDGSWQVLAVCVAQTCVGGTCRGQCEAGQLGCEGNTPQQCDGNGQWESLAACEGQTCAEGVCVGACVQGETRCAGNTPQRCDAAGQWQDGASCPSAEPVCQGGACIQVRSCVGLPATCGPNSNEVCCARGDIPGGTYNRSNHEAYPATVSSFSLDRFEITVGRFRRFVNGYPGSRPSAGDGEHPLVPGTGWDAAWDAELPADKAGLMAAVKCDASYQTWTDAPGSNENLPMNCITWFEAFAFCAWDGGRLPTEAEWNYSTAGGSEQRQYPWSVPPDSSLIDGTYAVYGCSSDGSSFGQCAFGDILPVGSRSHAGDGRWGQADLAGSMSEWNFDWHATYQSPCDNCAKVRSGPNREMRGGSWLDNELYLSSFIRGYDVPSGRHEFAGARCARTL